jgi:hypothetical protein
MRTANEEKLLTEIAQVRSEIRNRTLKYVLAALGLVAGLAWNDAIKASIEFFFPINKSGVQAKIVYAIIITLVVAVLSFYLTKFPKSEETKTEAEIKKDK